MKNALNFCVVLMAVLFLTGCSGKFEPTESTIYVTSKGDVKSAMMESFDKAYYDFEELSEDVEKAVKSYCLDVNEEAVTIESLMKESDEVALVMHYQTVDDYRTFNEVLLFTGTYAEAVGEGYLPEELHDAEGEIADVDSEELDNLKEQYDKKLSSCSDSNKLLQEKLLNKNAEIRSLKEKLIKSDSSIELLKNKINEFDQLNESLKENIEELKKDSSIKYSEYSQKLSKEKAITEKYRKIAKRAVDKYIENRAVALGVKPREIENKLSENYSFDDMDRVCEDLKTYKLNLINFK